MSDLEEREKFGGKRRRDRLKKGLERREEDLTKRARAASPLNERKRRQELFASK